MRSVKHIFLTAFIFSFLTGFAQDVEDNSQSGIEKSVFNVQTGFLGMWASHEARLSSTIALKTEIGLDAGFYYSKTTDDIEFVVAPIVNIEPRWYYNIKQRTA